MSQADDPNDDDIALAGEYALHLLDAEARRAFERRLAGDPALRNLLRDWDQGLVSIADEIPSVKPPRQLKKRIEKTLFQNRAQGAEQSRRWHFGGFFGALSAAALALLLVVALPETRLTTPGPAYTA
ncbi:MAG: hypothetical protein WBN04_20615, partial [Paracoccaceae bacterium]